MVLSLTFWIVAWVLMGVAFLMAASAIIFGARALDRNAEDGTTFLKHRDSLVRKEKQSQHSEA